MASPQQPAGHPRIPLPPVPLPDEVVALAAEFDDGRRSPAVPRNAATVVLLRDGDTGPEAYYLRRQRSMDFAGGMAVFPGGGVDARDFDADLGEGAWAGPAPSEWAEVLGVEEDLAVALVCAAVRETFEESGVLLAGPSVDAVVDDTTSDDWEHDRAALESRDLAFTDFLARRSLVLRTDLLGVWDAWLTPAFEPKRYATWFFVARLPEGQRTRDVSTESSSVTWLPAGGAVDQAEAGELAMMPPTYLTSLEVSGFGDVDALLAEARGRSASMHCPSVEPLSEGLGEGWTLSMPARHRPLLTARREERGRA
ncbi:NUDIX hydrolase [Nocardioides acrostichi]|uniref:NUDIX hydrolase n=1 Tax=Nocardioides acrostichi TaxID=2784339 RepID=A0A930Y7A8_9ACTN|nr:NUDIX hydrolase [Nocardioides acrostichi]MBF4163220.1 NUDIX hydrolase [Nocardioides acrostichi]